MEIFFRLLFGHLLADFTFQTNFLADWKRRRVMGLLVHVAIHPVCYVALTWPLLGDTWRSVGGITLSGWACVALITAIHWVEDWFRVRQINKGWSDNTLFYFWDQAVHIVALWFLSPGASQPLESMWPLVGSLFVVVTHFATVTIWFIEKDFYGREYPATEEKYLAILQRLAVWLAFFLPTPLWPVVVVVVLATFGRYIWNRRIDFSRASLIMGNVLALACGLLSRYSLGYHL